MISTLPHTIHHSAYLDPGHEAFRFAEATLSFEELVRQSNQLAHLLLERGAGKGDRIGIYLGRGLETAVSVFGIMQAGAVYVPLDPLAPARYTAWVIRDCGIKMLITQNSLQRKIKNILEQVGSLDLIAGLADPEVPGALSWDMIFEYPDSIPQVQISEDDLAYIMYTSGSTGLPKGIMHTHSSGLSYARLSGQLYGVNPDDRLGSHAPLHFDISTMAYFTAPLRGATSVIIPEPHIKLPASLTQLMQSEKLTIWYSAPLALIHILSFGDLENRDLSSLRWVLFGGEPFPPKYLRGLMNRLPDARFCNVYGPAEVNQCTNYQVTGAPEPNHPIPLGKIWDETEMMVVDELDHPVQPGMPGELLITSTTMMKGYWNQPTLTSSSFFIHSTNEGEKVYYRTGDLVKLNNRQDLVFLGRKDRQIKSRGYRVELEMVEAQLMAIEEIAEAAVFTVPDKQGGNQIEAAVILKTGLHLETNEIRNKLNELLPAYSIPSRIHLTADLPRTSTGKINHPVLVQTFINSQHD